MSATATVGPRLGTVVPHAASSLQTGGSACRLASGFGRKTRRLSDDVVPRGEQNRTEQ